MAAGDLSTQRFNRDEYLSPIAAGGPTRDDESGRQQTVIPGRDQLTKTLPRSVISTVGAEWRNLTPMWGGSWWQAVYYDRAVIRRDCEEMIPIFSQPFFDDSRSLP